MATATKKRTSFQLGAQKKEKDTFKMGDFVCLFNDIREYRNHCMWAPNVYKVVDIKKVQSKARGAWTTFTIESIELEPKEREEPALFLRPAPKVVVDRHIEKFQALINELKTVKFTD